MYDSVLYTPIRVDARYPIRAVSKITGLSLDTLRAWERRYQAVVPERTERGRQYGEAHVERLVLLSRLVQQGHAIGQIAGLATPELQGLLEIPAYSNPEPLPDLLAPVFEAIERFDGGRAADELSRLAAILAPRDFVYQVALPLMRETGIRWHSGQLAISQEHLLSQILRNLLGGMMRLFRHSGSAARIVFGTPAGESHEFGILAAAMLASLGGLEPVYLGPDLPALEIVRAAERSAAAIVVLAVTHPLRSSVEEIRTVAEGLPPGVEFWVGGDGSEGLDFSGISRPVVRVKDLAAFEAQCLRRRTEHGQKH